MFGALQLGRVSYRALRFSFVDRGGTRDKTNLVMFSLVLSGRVGHGRLRCCALKAGGTRDAKQILYGRVCSSAVGFGPVW